MELKNDKITYLYMYVIFTLKLVLKLTLYLRLVLQHSEKTTNITISELQKINPIQMKINSSNVNKQRIGS